MSQGGTTKLIDSRLIQGQIVFWEFIFSGLLAFRCRCEHKIQRLRACAADTKARYYNRVVDIPTIVISGGQNSARLEWWCLADRANIKNNFLPFTGGLGFGLIGLVVLGCCLSLSFSLSLSLSVGWSQVDWAAPVAGYVSFTLTRD